MQANESFALIRYNIDGSRDHRFVSPVNLGLEYTSMVIQKDNKIVLGGPGLITRLGATGNYDSVFNNNGTLQVNVGNAPTAINTITIYNNKLYVTGKVLYEQALDLQGNYGVIGKYFLGETGSQPEVTLVAPFDYGTYTKGENIFFKAIASDPDGPITNVAFYSDTTLLFTAIDTPYVFAWKPLRKGNFIVTAIVTDNTGLVNTSNRVHIYVVDTLTSPTLYGVTYYGGNAGLGIINKFMPVTNTLLIAKSFEGPVADPVSKFVQASDGKLYGMTSRGGVSNAGVIFSFNPVLSTYSRLIDFDNVNGALPGGSLIKANDGKLYGVTSIGGSNNAGVIFSFEPSSSTYTKLWDFDITNGGYPNGSLMQASDGKLYGMTSAGGSGGVGVIFSFDPSSFTYTKIFNLKRNPEIMQRWL